MIPNNSCAKASPTQLETFSCHQKLSTLGFNLQWTSLLLTFLQVPITASSSKSIRLSWTVKSNIKMSSKSKWRTWPVNNNQKWHKPTTRTRLTLVSGTWTQRTYDHKLTTDPWHNLINLTDQQRLNNHKLLKHKQDKGRKQGKKDRRPDKPPTEKDQTPKQPSSSIKASIHRNPETTKRQVDHMEQTKGKYIKERNQRKNWKQGKLFIITLINYEKISDHKC